MLEYLLPVSSMLLFVAAIAYAHRHRQTIASQARRSILSREVREWLEGTDRDRVRDLRLFLERNVDIMDVAQLAEGQWSKRDLRTVYVCAPDFLELYDERVYRSTCRTLDDPGREVVFYFFLSESKGHERYALLLNRLQSDTTLGQNVEARVKRVVVTEEFFLGDYTIWNPEGPNPKGFQNLKAEGRTSLCVEMPYDHVADVAAKLGVLARRFEARLAEGEDAGATVVSLEARRSSI